MRFTIEQIRNYLKSQDSMGDALYNLSEDNIIKANMPDEDDEEPDDEDILSNDYPLDLDEEEDEL